MNTHLIKLYQVYTDGVGTFYATKSEARKAFDAATEGAELTEETVATDRRTLCQIINLTGGFVCRSKVLQTKLEAKW